MKNYLLNPSLPLKNIPPFVNTTYITMLAASNMQNLWYGGGTMNKKSF